MRDGLVASVVCAAALSALPSPTVAIAAAPAMNLRRFSAPPVKESVLASQHAQLRYDQWCRSFMASSLSVPAGPLIKLGRSQLQPSMIATARIQPAETRSILTGKHDTMNPVDSKNSRLCNFSMWQ
jgi:hypothetical protein